MQCDLCKNDDGKLTQVPYPVPLSMSYCDRCYELEGIAYNVWRSVTPKEIKRSAFNIPIPFMKSAEDIPQIELKEENLDLLKEHFRNKLVK